MKYGDIRIWGKIQGDGRKFLERFKSHFGSQILSQSLNEVHIYRLQPKSATKGDFLLTFLSLFRVGVTDCFVFVCLFFVCFCFVCLLLLFCVCVLCVFVSSQRMLPAFDV